MSQQLKLEKNRIRQIILKKRKLVSDLERRNAEIKMTKILKDCEVFASALSVHIFMSKKKEPSTKEIIRLCWREGKKVSIPYIIQGKKKLFHAELNSFNELSVGSFGVLEPSFKKKSKSNHFDLIIVPGLAFDSNGIRIGYGMGYYDRFLCQTNAFRMALAFDFQLLKQIPSDCHDIKMDGIITENRKIII